MTGSKIKYLFWTVYSLLLHGMDLSTLLGFPVRNKKPGTKKEILVVRLDAIGDFVLWMDAAKEIRRLYPMDQCRITLLGNRLWIPLAEGLPWFDEILPLERKRFYFNPFYRFRILRKLRRSGFDVVIQPTYSREFLYGDSVVRFCGAKERIGSTGDTLNQFPYLKRISDRWYTRLIPASKKPLMELVRNTEFLRGLKLEDARADVPAWAVPPCVFPALRESIDPDYYILFPGATVALRQWPAKFFAEVAQRLYRKTGWTGVVCAGGEDREFGEQMCQLAGVPVLNLAGRTSLPELASVIAGARLLIGNETSAIHIAAAVSVPSVCILGGGHHGRFVPYQVEVKTNSPLPVPVSFPMDCYHCNWVCIYDPRPGSPAPCVENISVDAVWDAVQSLLLAAGNRKEDPGGHPSKRGPLL